MSYFKRFPKLVYDFNREGIVNSVVDIRDKTNSIIVKQAEKLGIKIHWKSNYFIPFIPSMKINC